MRGTKAKRLRRENPEPKVPHYTTPVMINIKGKPTFIPRRARRLATRQMIKGIRTGRISLDKLMQQDEDTVEVTLPKEENDRDK